MKHYYFDMLAQYRKATSYEEEFSPIIKKIESEVERPSSHTDHSTLSSSLFRNLDIDDLRLPEGQAFHPRLVRFF
jgi:hypothetical protein